jgi:hypothetical protein
LLTKSDSDYRLQSMINGSSSYVLPQWPQSWYQIQGSEWISRKIGCLTQLPFQITRLSLRQKVKSETKSRKCSESSFSSFVSILSLIGLLWIGNRSVMPADSAFRENSDQPH